MSISMTEACHLVQNLAGISIHVLYSQTAIESFCSEYRFHDVQEYLTPKGLQKLFAGLQVGHLLCYKDVFRLRFVFCLADDVPIAIGPYCTEILTKQDLFYLSSTPPDSEFPTDDLLAFRSRFPVTSKGQIIHYTQCLLNSICDGELTWKVEDIDASISASSISNIQSGEVQTRYSDIIEERYRIEQEMIDQIKNGKAAAAVSSYRAMAQGVAYLKRIGNTMENARVGAAITRTTTRLAASQAGLPASVIDSIASDNVAAVQNATGIDEVRSLVEAMIRTFCNAVYQQKNNHYSKLVLCVIYYIEREFKHDISISDLAEELGVSATYLIKKCRQELGMTPNVFLRKTRMTHAAKLLRETRLPIQKINSEVGILDANYFIKLFRQEYGQTPSDYRRENML